MSTVKDLADEEAARAEVDEPDGEPDGDEPEAPEEPETPEEPEEPAAVVLTDKEVEKRYNAAGKLAKAYATKVTATLGPELMANLVPSPLDAIPGFVQVDNTGQPDPETKAQTLAFLLYEPPIEYRQNPATKTCTLCGGPGDLQTGSKRKGNELTRCPQCNGLGYTTPENTVVGLTQQPAAVLAAVPAPTENGAPVTHGLEDPEVTRLRAAGYTVLEPIHLQ